MQEEFRYDYNDDFNNATIYSHTEVQADHGPDNETTADDDDKVYYSANNIDSRNQSNSFTSDHVDSQGQGKR